MKELPVLNYDVYEKILEKVVELEVADLEKFISLRGIKWTKCKNDCHNIQSFYAIGIPNWNWKRHLWPEDLPGVIDKLIHHTEVIYQAAVLRFTWIVPLVNFAMNLSEEQKKTFMKFNISFYVDCHRPHNFKRIPSDHHSHRIFPEEVYTLIDSYKEDDPRLKKYCWQNEPPCICYFAQMHEEFICETYH